MSLSVTEKMCTQCGSMEPLENFYHKEGGRLGKRSECKVCSSIIYDERKADGKIKSYPSKKREQVFKEEHGFWRSTLLRWMKSKYDLCEIPYRTMKEIPEEERENYFDMLRCELGVV